MCKAIHFEKIIPNRIKKTALVVLIEKLKNYSFFWLLLNVANDECIILRRVNSIVDYNWSKFDVPFLVSASNLEKLEMDFYNDSIDTQKIYNALKYLSCYQIAWQVNICSPIIFSMYSCNEQCLIGSELLKKCKCQCVCPFSLEIHYRNSTLKSGGVTKYTSILQDTLHFDLLQANNGAFKNWVSVKNLIPL